MPCGGCADAFCLAHYGPLASDWCARCTTAEATECPKGFRYRDGTVDACLPSLQATKFGRCIWCERELPVPPRATFATGDRVELPGGRWVDVLEPSGDGWMCRTSDGAVGVWSRRAIERLGGQVVRA